MGSPCWVTLLLSLLASGCSCDEEKEPAETASHGPVEQPKPLGTPPNKQLTLFEIQDRCTLWHQGLVLDMASPSLEARRMFRLGGPELGPVNDRVGESFRLLDQMNTDFVFWLTEEMKDFEFSARVFGLGSERLAAYVDGERWGAAGLKEGKATQISISGRDKVLAPGRHKLTISLSRPRGSAPAAEVSWVRIGPRGETSPTPATRREVFSEVTIEENRLRSVVLRPGARLRCPFRVPPRAKLLTEFGIWGEGAAEAEVAVHTGDGQRIVVTSQEREEDDPRTFSLWEADLSPFAGQFIDLEIFAPRALDRARLAFGNPRIESPGEAQESSVRTKRAIIVVLSGLGAIHMPPLSAENGLPLLNQLTREGALFTGYRASTTSIPGVMASLLTGLPPWTHAMDREHDRLSQSTVTLASLIEAQGGRTSFFTGVPLSAAPFGFDRGFAKFDAVYPQEDLSATEPLERAKKWISASLDYPGPVLSVIHLRGGHPPFDVTKEAAVDLAPKEYGGDLSPRRAGIQLAEIRGRSSARNRRMPNEDWERLHSLQKAALTKQNSELGALVGWLRKRGVYEDTMLVVMGDVGAGERPTIPYATNAPLSESALLAPLIIKFPEGHLAGKQIEGWFAPQDVTMTVAAALGIETELEALDLSRHTSSMAARVRPHMAHRGEEYSMRLDSLLLIGKDQGAPFLCAPGVDPTCQEDRSAARILEARSLWLSAWDILGSAAERGAQREAVTSTELGPDDEPSPEVQQFENALTVWGIDR